MKMTSLYRTIFFIGLLLLSLDNFATVLTISGKVFHDRNKNSTPEASETGIGKVYIRLFYRTDFGRWNALSTKTNSDGTYSFSVDLQSWETGFKYSVLELGPNPGPALQSIDPKDFNYNDPDIPGGFNGTTTLRRYSGPGPIVMRSYTHNFGHANFQTFSPALPNALIVGSEGGSRSPSSIFGIDLSTGNTTRLLDSITNPVKDPIVGLGYHQKTNTFMGCAVKDGAPGSFVIIENTSPLTVTKLPRGENVSFYMWATHAVDINQEGFMVDIECGTGERRQVLDVRPTSVNFLQMVDYITNKFNPTLPAIQLYGGFAAYSDLAFKPGTSMMNSINPIYGGVLTKMSLPSLVWPPWSMEEMPFLPPIPDNSYLLTFSDNSNQLFVISRGARMLYRLNLNTQNVNTVGPFSLQLLENSMDGASNSSATIPAQNAALRYGIADERTEVLQESTFIKPNPVTVNKLSISHKSGIDVVDVINVSGQSLLHQKAFRSTSIDISLPSNTATGSYLIRIVGSDGKIVTKNIVVE